MDAQTVDGQALTYVLVAADGYGGSVGRPGMPEPPPEGPTIEELLDAFMAELTERTGARPGRIVLGGFSQGGGLALRYGLPRPETFAGLAVQRLLPRRRGATPAPARRAR